MIRLALIALLLAGCAAESVPAGKPVLAAVPFLTKETGQLHIERQEFIDTWASVQVLFDALLANEKAVCAGPCRVPERCTQIPDVEAQGKVIKLTVEAKIRNPEARVDWANVAKILGLIAKMAL